MIGVEQLANAYAIAKICGSELSLEEFQKLYSQYYDEIIKELNSKPVQLAKTKVLDRSKLGF